MKSTALHRCTALTVLLVQNSGQANFLGNHRTSRNGLRAKRMGYPWSIESWEVG